MTRPRLRAVLAAVVWLAVPASAMASGHKGYQLYEPPGKAGASQYAEVVPSSAGGVKTPTDLSSPPSGNLDQLGDGQRTARKLATLGTAGTSAAGWARATAPTLTPPPNSSGAKPAANAKAAALSGGSAATGVLNLITGSDSDGLGLLLPLLLAISLAGALGYMVGQRVRPRRL